jgi:hypothetical protein
MRAGAFSIVHNARKSKGILTVNSEKIILQWHGTDWHSRTKQVGSQFFAVQIADCARILINASLG